MNKKVYVAIGIDTFDDEMPDVEVFDTYEEGAQYCKNQMGKYSTYKLVTTLLNEGEIEDFSPADIPEEQPENTYTGATYLFKNQEQFDKYLNSQKRAAVEEEHTNPLSESNVRCAARLANADQQHTVELAKAVRAAQIEVLEKVLKKVEDQHPDNSSMLGKQSVDQFRVLVYTLISELTSNHTRGKE